MRSNVSSIAFVLAVNLFVVMFLTTGCKEEFERPDPEVCQPMITLISATLSDGTVKEVIDPNSYWFCVKRSEPYNQNFHRRPNIVDYVADSIPTAVSADDLMKINQAEEDAQKYIERLEASCRR